MTDITFTKGNLTIIQDPLGYRRLDPLPDPQKVNQYYGAEDAFYLGGEDWLRKEQREHRQGLWLESYRWQGRLLEQACDKVYRLVDLGAGAGWFVDYWNREYGPAVGVEPSRTVLAYSPCPDKVEVSLRMASRRFRYGVPVYLRAALLLEHLPDPVGYLKEATGWFPGVRAVMIMVPNDWNPLQLRLNQRLKRDKQFWWLADYHCNYFDPAGLKAVMEAAGLRVVMESANCPIELFALAGLNYIGNDWLGQKVHRLRLEFERRLGPLAFRLYEELYRRYRWGRDLIFIGVPK